MSFLQCVVFLHSDMHVGMQGSQNVHLGKGGGPESSVEGLPLAKILPSRHVAAPAIHRQSTLWHWVVCSCDSPVLSSEV